MSENVIIKLPLPSSQPTLRVVTEPLSLDEELAVLEFLPDLFPKDG